MKTISTTIYVEPTAKGRPRFAISGGHAHAYTPAKTRNAEQMIQALIRREFKDDFNSFDREAPLSLSVTFYRERPKHLTKKVLMPVTRPDIDQYIKTCLDALNKFLYADDSQIVTLKARKRFGSPPRIELMISEELE